MEKLPPECVPITTALIILWKTVSTDTPTPVHNDPDPDPDPPPPPTHTHTHTHSSQPPRPSCHVIGGRNDHHEQKRPIRHQHRVNVTKVSSRLTDKDSQPPVYQKYQNMIIMLVTVLTLFSFKT